MNYPNMDDLKRVTREWFKRRRTLAEAIEAREVGEAITALHRQRQPYVGPTMLGQPIDIKGDDPRSVP